MEKEEFPFHKEIKSKQCFFDKLDKFEQGKPFGDFLSDIGPAETNKLGRRKMNTIKGTSPRRNLISFSALLVSQDTLELYSTNLSEIKFPTPAATRRTLDHWICTTKMQFAKPHSELSLTHCRTDSNLCFQHKTFRWFSQPVQRNEFLSIRI